MSTPCKAAFQLLVDADACPVTGMALQIAARFGVQVVLVCDNAHVMNKPGAQTVTVDKGADSADFALLSRVRQGDVVITGDYGLAAMALARGGASHKPRRHALYGAKYRCAAGRAAHSRQSAQGRRQAAGAKGARPGPGPCVCEGL